MTFSPHCPSTTYDFTQKDPERSATTYARVLVMFIFSKVANPPHSTSKQQVLGTAKLAVI